MMYDSYQGAMFDAAVQLFVYYSERLIPTHLHPAEKLSLLILLCLHFSYSCSCISILLIGHDLRSRHRACFAREFIAVESTCVV